MKHYKKIKLKRLRGKKIIQCDPHNCNNQKHGLLRHWEQPGAAIQECNQNSQNIF